MRKEYDFSDGSSNPFAERIRQSGMTVTEYTAGEKGLPLYYPPGTFPSAAKRVHIYAVRSRWAVRTEGASRAFRRVGTEQEAMEIGLELARKHGADVVIHNHEARRRRKGTLVA